LREAAIGKRQTANAKGQRAKGNGQWAMGKRENNYLKKHQIFF
jgi:hypothetical protein